MQQQNWWQLVYVDNLHLTCFEARKFVNLWIVLPLFELVGTPLFIREVCGRFESSVRWVLAGLQGVLHWNHKEARRLVGGFG